MEEFDFEINLSKNPSGWSLKFEDVRFFDEDLSQIHTKISKLFGLCEKFIVAAKEMEVSKD